MYKITIKTLFVLLFCFSALGVHANVTINEIMYDVEGTDTDREWIEVYNSGNESIDLSTWKFVEANVNHSLMPFDGGSSVVSGGYAIIADKPEKFKADWPNFSGVLFDSSFSLNNDPGEILSLKDSTGMIVDTVTYVTSVGAQGDGNTLNRSSSSFIVAQATPGFENSTTQNNTDIEDENTDDSTENETSISPSSSSSSQKISEPITPKINAQIISKSSGITGTVIIFEPKVTGYGGEILTQGKFIWNLGNGASFENTKNEKITYIYETPGEYVVSLEYIRSNYQTEPDAVDRFVVQIIEPAVIVSNVFPDGSIEITNKSAKEVNLSNWVLSADTYSFSFPSNTIILAGRKIVFSPKVTKFPGGLQNVSILLPSTQIASMYSQFKNENTSQSKNINQPVKVSYESSLAKSYAQTSSSESIAQISDEYQPISLTASAINALDEEGNSSRNNTFPVIIFVILIISGVGIVWRIRKTFIDKEKTQADEFELVD